jgi:cellulose synthase/poly-beta-1,6-N-acetylglucosamine synthase-like glycosyltransferase
MNKLKASLIISVYNDVVALKSVLDSLSFQTEKSFEVIISEDAQHDTMKSFLESYHFSGKIYHLSQLDTGWQKNKALNRASLFAHTNHLVFIDGDTVLHPRFIEFHIKLFDVNLILAGKRIKLDPESSSWLKENFKRLPQFQNYLLHNYFGMRKRGAKFMEEGIFISPDSWLGFIPRMRKMSHLKGCNMSFSKKALYDINGFDEEYTRPAIGEDIDLQWRFEGMGYKLKSLRNMAVQYHLYHKENWTSQDENIRMMSEKQEQELYFCCNGIKQ